MRWDSKDDHKDPISKQVTLSFETYSRAEAGHGAKDQEVYIADVFLVFLITAIILSFSHTASAFDSAHDMLHGWLPEPNIEGTEYRRQNDSHASPKPIYPPTAIGRCPQRAGLVQLSVATFHIEIGRLIGVCRTETRGEQVGHSVRPRDPD